MVVRPLYFTLSEWILLIGLFSESTDQICSKEESEQLRMRLRDIGVEQFIRETLMSGKYSAMKLCSAFRISILDFTENDESLYHLLGFAMHRELAIRRRLEQYQTIEDAANLLNSAKNILVITGAGVRQLLRHPVLMSPNS
jgi:NAD+-dependent protein deacetylase SIR2